MLEKLSKISNCYKEPATKSCLEENTIPYTADFPTTWSVDLFPPEEKLVTQSVIS